MPKQKKFKNKKVLVAMSGGVDSSVTAALLIDQGYDVTAAYMKQWSGVKSQGDHATGSVKSQGDHATSGDGICTWKKDRRDALRVAAHLDIDLLTFDYQKEYKKHVFDYMIKEYKKGRTPNPDILCNQFIKFGFWLQKAKQLGFDYLATGHYADIDNQQGVYTLLQAKDTNKDQTYFLHKLDQKQLSGILFPLGTLNKSEVRTIAKQKKLPTANRKESMGVCFIGEMPMKQFLSTYIKQTPGKILLESGEIVGTHDGLAYYTIGQRHVGVASSKIQKNNTDNKPLFVISKNLKTNDLIIGFEDSQLLYKKEILLEDMHWISGLTQKKPVQCLVRFRHRQEMQECRVTMTSNTTAVLLCKTKQKAITPGQFAVLYTDKACLGGGIIGNF